MTEHYVGPTIIAVCNMIAGKLQHEGLDPIFSDKEDIEDINYALSQVGCSLPKDISSLVPEQRNAIADDIRNKAKAAQEKNQQWFLPEFVNDSKLDAANKEKIWHFIMYVKLEKLQTMLGQEHLSANDWERIDTVKKMFIEHHLPIPHINSRDTGDEYRKLLDFFIDAIQAYRSYHIQKDGKQDGKNQAAEIILDGPSIPLDAEDIKKVSKTDLPTEEEDDLMSIIADLDGQLASGELEPEECWQAIKDIAIGFISGNTLEGATSLERLAKQMIAPASKDIALSLTTILTAINDIAEDPELKQQTERMLDIRIRRLGQVRSKLIEIGFSETSADTAVLSMLQSGGILATLVQILPAAKRNSPKK